MDQGLTIIDDNESGSQLFVNIGLISEGNLLEGHKVIITGATGGIGKSIAMACAKQKADIILMGRDLYKLDALCTEIGSGAGMLSVDFTSSFNYDEIIDEAFQRFGPIDCLVNNAGISRHEGDFMNVTENDWDDQFSVNLKAPFFLTQSWLKQYRKYNIKNGRIVMMASDTSGMGSTIPYGLTKAAIASFTHGLAKKLIKEGIRVNAIAPGTTLTPMTDDLTHGRVIRESTLGGRTLFPEEIAQICVLLLSDLTTCVSGNIFGCSESNICFDNIKREEETNP